MFSKLGEATNYRAAGWSWFSLPGRNQRLMEGLRHPFGLALLTISTGLALAMILHPALERWSAWAPAVIVWGAVCYVVAAFAVSRTRPTPREPEIRRLDSVRVMIKTKRDERRSAEARPYSAITRTLGDAYDHLDRRIMPALAELIEKQKMLAADLKSFEDGTVEPPEPEYLERLKQLFSRRKATIEECVQQSANAAITLIEMLQNDQSPELARNIETWRRELETTLEAVVEVTQGTVDDPPQEPPKKPVKKRVESTARSDAEPARRTLTFDDLYKPLEEALRHLNPATNLVDCELGGLLPTLITAQCGNGQQAEPGVEPAPPTPVEKANATRAVIVEAIEAMKPDGHVSVTNPAATHYIILHEQYVLGRQVIQIQVRLSFAQAAYFRHRRNAIRALAMELVEKELR